MTHILSEYNITRMYNYVTNDVKIIYLLPCHHSSRLKFILYIYNVKLGMHINVLIFINVIVML